MSASKGFDRRQRVNLSEMAHGVIMSDGFTFSENNIVNYSDTICRVFLMFVEQSAAKQQKSERITDLLAKKPSRAQQKAPSLQNAVMEYLSAQDVLDIIENGLCKGSVGKFIKAVIEEYAELPFVKRELIYFRDIVDKISSNLNRRQLRIVNRSNAYIVKPYKIMFDKLSTYNYLICYAATASSPDKYEFSSFRISRIKSVTALNDFEFYEYETDELNQAIEEKTVQFLWGDLFDVVVEFTDRGKDIFRSILYLRPAVKSFQNNVYTFRCTLQHAEFYFFDFGGNARIIEPPELKKRLAQRYKEAYDAYK